MRKRIWVMLAFFLVLGIVSFSVQSGPIAIHTACK